MYHGDIIETVEHFAVISYCYFYLNLYDIRCPFLSQLLCKSAQSVAVVPSDVSKSSDNHDNDDSQLLSCKNVFVVVKV